MTSSTGQEHGRWRPSSAADSDLPSYGSALHAFQTCDWQDGLVPSPLREELQWLHISEGSYGALSGALTSQYLRIDYIWHLLQELNSTDAGLREPESVASVSAGRAERAEILPKNPPHQYPE